MVAASPLYYFLVEVQEVGFGVLVSVLEDCFLHMTLWALATQVKTYKNLLMWCINTVTGKG